MNARTLKSYALVRGLSQSDIARAAGVTRQTVSLWFHKRDQKNINLYASNLQRVAEFLSVNVEELLRPLPILSDPSEKKKWETKLLWDRLYPNLESFIAAVIRGQQQALARLTQVCGLYEGAKIAGQQIWRKFPHYKRGMHPAARRQAEVIWKIHHDLT